MLQSVAVCCRVLQCVAECDTSVSGVSGVSSVTPDTLVCCRVLQCVAECDTSVSGVSIARHTRHTSVTPVDTL